MCDQNQTAAQKDSLQTVTSLGNSWIICRSKSHAGRIYYFNTFSGEAAWNLSDQEIEKAKTRTKFLESQSGGKFEGCPEPKDPPMDNINRNSKSPQTSQILIPSRVYNKQIINNQFPKQAMAPVVASQCSKCSSVNTFDAMGVNMPVPHNCNPNVWTIPPHHQIVIAPTPPVLNQLHTPINNPCNNIEQRVSVENTSLPLTHRFNQMKTPNRNSQFANGINKRNNNNSFGQRNTGTKYHKNFNKFTNPVDLRQRLTARRKSNHSWNNLNENPIYRGEDISARDTQRIQIIKPTIDIAPSDADDLWLKANATVQGTQLLLNVISLKQKVTTKINSVWYIVADTGVLLNHINLINVIVNSDEHCQLMVPDFVMAALQTKSRANDTQLLSRAHNILEILSQQFTAGNAVMGKDPTSGSNIYDFCYKLLTQNHDVALISNNVQWKNDSIITLNVQELKDMLSTVVKPVKRLVDDCKIQITIPNNTSIEEDKEIFGSKSMSVGIQIDSNKNKFIKTDISSSMNLNKKKVDTKRTVDIGIQTDIDSSQNSSPTTVKSLGVNTETCLKDNFSEKFKAQFTCDRDVVNSDEMPRRREIRLKRNLSLQPVTDNNVEKKQFKWRRKRHASIQYANATDQKATSYSSNTFNIEGRSKDNETDLEPSRLDNIIVPESRSTCYEAVDGSETSSSCFIQNSLDDKVIIEETSTSGVISNSADSESMHSLKQDKEVCKKMIYDESDVCKCVMFEVETPVMEEYLKMRSDEWVSRFVQIMEEVLTQILQQTPVFSHRTLPPPWTLHEATECIKKKFEHDSDVVDAANRLTRVLFKISDDRGKICVDMKPSEFMEMYSYGVYLVDALQSVLSNSEDLQTAADSLAKLLSDIQDPTLDTSHTEAFMDNSHVPPAEVTEANISNISNDIEEEIPKSEEKELPDLNSPACSTKSNMEGTKYNLRSNSKQLTEDEAPREQPVKFIRKIDIESSFFSSLKLKKNQDNVEDNIGISTYSSTVCNGLSKSGKNKTLESVSNAKAPNNNEIQSDTPNSEPKIIRNFSKCIEFEEKLKCRQKETMEVDTIDYSHISDDEDDGYEYYDDYTHCDYDFYDQEEEIDKMETYEDNKENESHVIDQAVVDKNSNTDLKSLVYRLVNEIQETFLDVQSFCAKVIEELSVSKALKTTLSPSRKLQIKEKAETARFVIENLSKTFKNILSREGGPNNIQNICKEAGIHLDGNNSIEYSNIIAQYPRQANILVDAVNIIIEVVE